jgi:outer membrane protein W
VRAFYTYAYSDDHAIGEVNPGTEDFERTEAIVNNGDGLGVEGECLVTPRLGIPLTLMWLSHDSHLFYDSAAAWEMDSKDFEWLSITSGLNYHFLEPDAGFDLWGGVFLGWAALDEVSYDIPALGGRQNVNYDDPFVYGAQLGVDIPAKKGFAFYGGLRWMSLEAESTNVGGNRDFDLNPLMWQAGLSYRF